MSSEALHLSLLSKLAAGINADGPAIEVVADASSPDGARVEQLTEQELRGYEQPLLVVRTSGSTGRAKRTVLSVEAMASSAQATAEYLGFEGQWLLALPVHYIAGLSVLTRSLFAGTRPVLLPEEGTFTPAGFTQAAESMLEKKRLTALVPTQLARLLDSPSAQTVAALKRFDAILLGGARASRDLLTRARHHGLKIFQTYGSSETAGGLVYNGTALPGVKLAVGAEGRVRVTGPMLSDGYLGDPAGTAEHFPLIDGERWYLTDDAGTVRGQRLQISGRLDDVINTGGLKLSAGQLTAHLEEFFDQVLVVPVPDAQWGQAVGLGYSGPTDTNVAFAAVRQAIGPHAVPKRTKHYRDGLPMLPNGKFDRRKIIEDLSQ